MNNIVVFKINKKLDFQNHLIGMRVYKRRHKNPASIKYYKKLKKTHKSKRFNIFKEKTSRFYDADRKKFRDLTLK